MSGLSSRPRDMNLVHIIDLIESKIDDFEPRGIANIMWSFAKLDLRHQTALWGALCAKAEGLAGSFNPQEVANTLWAFATLGVSPSALLLASLSSAAE